MFKGNKGYLAIIGILIIILAIRECNYRPEVIEHYNYLTDTTYSKKMYTSILDRVKGLEETLKETPPKEVIYYPIENPKGTTIEKVPDSILIYIQNLNRENDSLRLAIPDKYLTNYPFADKLISFQLDSEEFKITTLNIQGELKEANYPLYLDTYRYYWEGNTLHHSSIKRPKGTKAKQEWNQLYFRAGYEIVKNKALIGLDYHKIFGRFKVGIYTDLTIEENPSLSASAVLGYRLLK